MNKIGKAILSIFKGIYFVIDKVIITPISKLAYNVSKLVSKNNGRIEKFLTKPRVLLYISLGLAVLFFFLIDKKVINLVETEAEILTNQPVKVEYNKEAYVVEGVPDAVDITLIGRKSDLYLAKQLGENEVVLDLTDLEPSNEQKRVKLTYNQTINTLSYKLDPTYVYVTVKRKVSDLKTLKYDIINQDKLNAINPELSVTDVELSKPEVVVKGSQDTLNKIATVKALVDLNNSKFTAKGTYTLESLPVVAYDEDGNILKNVEIVPETVSGSITFTSYSKNVPIKIETTGDLVNGKAISNITINGKANYDVTIYGDEASLESINSVPITIDVTDQGNNGSKTYNVSIAKPVGVRYMPDTSATIEVSFGEAAQKTVENVPVETRNVPTGMSVNAATDSDKTVSVQVKGTEDVINSITAENIIAYIDLSNYKAGTHSVAVQVEGNNAKAQYIVTSPINVILTNNK